MDSQSGGRSTSHERLVRLRREREREATRAGSSEGARDWQGARPCGAASKVKERSPTRSLSLSLTGRRSGRASLDLLRRGAPLGPPIERVGAQAPATVCALSAALVEAQDVPRPRGHMPLGGRSVVRRTPSSLLARRVTLLRAGLARKAESWAAALEDSTGVSQASLRRRCASGDVRMLA